MTLVEQLQAFDPIKLRKHFLSTLYEVLPPVISPTPYLELREEAQGVAVTFLDGRGKLPAEKSIEATTLDFKISSLFFDNINILDEGITGVGKTFTGEALFTTLFGQEGQYTLRLGGGLLGQSPLEPFTRTVLDHGIPKILIDHERCQRYGGIFIDEINMGDSQQTFQVIDGKINLHGETGHIRLPILGTDRFKKMAIIAAMNPATAEYAGAIELNAAGENRFLKFRYPNGAEEAGSSQISKKRLGDLHAAFWQRFAEKTGLTGSWKEIYPFVTDPHLLTLELDGRAQELIDATLGFVTKHPEEVWKRNKELLRQAGYETLSTVRRDNTLQRIEEKQQSLKLGFVRRDLEKIRDLSRLLAFIKSM